MYDRRVKRLPVVDHSGALVGIVTRADLLKVFLRSDDELRFDVLDHVSGDPLRLPPARSRSRSATASSASPAGSRATARRWPW
jgi:CBS domain-containing protein